MNFSHNKKLIIKTQFKLFLFPCSKVLENKKDVAYILKVNS